MDALIAELESAAEGSRELDYAIAKETGWRFAGEKQYKEWGMLWRDATTDEPKQLPWWTTSLDGALTLVPEGWTFCIVEDATSDIWADVRRIGVGTHIDWPDRDKGIFARTPVLALCIAALRARPATEEAA